MSIKLRYISALLLIAIIVSTSAMLMRYVSQSQENDAVTINVAGQQRMLSQRIALFIERISACDNSVEEHTASLAEIVDKFETNHQYLTTLPALPNAVSEIYFGSENVDKATKDYVESTRNYISNPPCSAIPNIYTADQTETRLELLNKIVQKFETDAKQKVNFVEELQMGLWLVTLLILFLVAIVIFRPMEKQITSTIRRLDKAIIEAKNAEQKAIEASKAKSEFLASMSHELRTPMNGLFGMIELAMDNPSKSNNYLTKAKNAGRQLLMLINDVLDLSKIEAGKLRVDNISFDLYQLIDDVVSLQAISCRTKGLEFSYFKETDLPDAIIGDPTRISQVLHNLLSNAIKFTEKGKVALHVSVTVKDKKHYLTYVVKDSGVGISKDNQLRIFNKFEQADQTTTRLYGGTGLGLSISSMLTELMEGTLSVDSTLGEGSTFTFSIPIRIDKRAMPLQSKTMLNCAIVDDLQTSLEYFEHLVKFQGLKATTYQSAAEFLNDKPDSYDLLILDLSMPNMDGVSAIEAMLSAKLKKMPYILLASAVLEHLECSDEVRNAIWRTHAKPVDRLAIERDLLELQTRVQQNSTEHNKNNNLGKHILVVEDNEINAEVVKSMLENEKYEVSLAFDGQKAIDACLIEDYDLILMDLQMPVLGGLGATKKLRDQYKLKTPIVALTANAFAEDRAECFAAGMNDFIEKPIDKTKLLSTVERFITMSK